MYNGNNQLTIHLNQLDQEETYSYNENGWLIAEKRFDGTNVIYTRDAAGRATKVAHPQSTSDITYLSNGKISRVQEGTHAIDYKYSNDGTLLSQSFEDGRTQSYALDKSSRIVKDTDIFGVVRQTAFDELGHVASRTCQTDVVSYKYGTANHA